MAWKDFLQHNFDKLLLILLVHALITLMITTVSHDANLTAWMQNEASTAMGALIMLITGRATKPEPSVSSKTTSTTTSTEKNPPAAVTPEVDLLENPALVEEVKPDLPVFANQTQR